MKDLDVEMNLDSIYNLIYSVINDTKKSRYNIFKENFPDQIDELFLIREVLPFYVFLNNKNLEELSIIYLSYLILSEVPQCKVHLKTKYKIFNNLDYSL